MNKKLQMLLITIVLILAPVDISYKKYLKHPTDHTFHFEPVTEAKVAKTIKNVKKKQFCPWWP